MSLNAGRKRCQAWSDKPNNRYMLAAFHLETFQGQIWRSTTEVIFTAIINAGLSNIAGTQSRNTCVASQRRLVHGTQTGGNIIGRLGEFIGDRLTGQVCRHEDKQDP